MEERNVTRLQLSKIYALAKKHGMDNELLHSYVEALIGKDSLKKLSYEEAERVADSLMGKDVVSRFPRKYLQIDKKD